MKSDSKKISQSTENVLMQLKRTPDYGFIYYILLGAGLTTFIISLVSIYFQY